MIKTITNKFFRLPILILSFVFALTAGGLLSTNSYSAAIYVPTQYPTIQQAIDAATDGDEIIVFPGTYTENINFSYKNIILRSIDPTNADTVANTIIKGDPDISDKAVVTFGGSESASCKLAGFTITGGHISDSATGAGIRGNGTMATICCNRIIGNQATFGGGLAYCHGTIQNNIISANYAGWGAAFDWCGGVIQNNVISNNTAGGFGIVRNCNGIIQNNTISNNYSYGHAGALIMCGYYSGNSLIQNNIISYNTAVQSGGGLWECKGTIQNNIIIGNAAQNLYGGGLYLCSGVIQNNTVAWNSAREGAGLCACSGIIHNNFISGNTAVWSGGAYGGGLDYCEGTIQNNIISYNHGGSYGGGLLECRGVLRNNTIYGNTASSGGGGLAFCSTLNITNCIIWANSAPSGAQLFDCSTPYYSCIQNWTGGGVGNIATDPQLVNPAGNDFHLSQTSPCIDAGCEIPSLTFDFEGNNRPTDNAIEKRGDGSDFDIGAYEYAFNLLQNSYFTTDTSRWQYLPFGGVTSGGLWRWEPEYAGRTGVLRISQKPGLKLNVCQLLSVKTGKWYTLEAKVASDISEKFSQKVYAFIGQYSEPNKIKNTIAESLQAGNLIPGLWTPIQVSFYSENTIIGISIISIIPNDFEFEGNLYVDDVLLYEHPEFKITDELPIPNNDFRESIDAWSYIIYGNATSMGRIQWEHGPVEGRTGLLVVNQKSGDKLAGAQFYEQKNLHDYELLGSLWILSDAVAVESTQKVYVVMSSYDSETSRIISNVQNAIQAGNLVPNSWTELKVASYPKSELIAPTFIVILPTGRPQVNLFIDECRFFVLKLVE